LTLPQIHLKLHSLPIQNLLPLQLPPILRHHHHHRRHNLKQLPQLHYRLLPPIRSRHPHRRHLLRKRVAGSTSN
jgi:hypothetical protein